MGVGITGVTHWSIPVRDIDEAEQFYGEVLGLKHVGRLANNEMTCFTVAEHKILLCKQPIQHLKDEEIKVHHSFVVGPESLVEAAKMFAETGVHVVDLVYRRKGFFTGRELYFYDPSGNKIELRDPTWKEGMPEPTYDEVVAS
jgi:extradiol dioxygenase family protein